MTEENKDEKEPLNIVVVGAGGVGSWLLEGLCRLTQYNFPGSVITIVDGDAYEPHNKERQNFQEIGNKAQIMAMQLQPQYDSIYVLPDPRWVVFEIPEDSESDEMVVASELLEENALVFVTVDNFAARKALFDAAQDYDNIHVFTGGNDDNLYGSYYHYHREDGQNVTDHPSEWHPELVDPPDRNPGLLSCGERVALEGSTQVLAANMAVASLLLARTHLLVVDGQKEDHQSEIFFDFSAGLAQAFDRRVEETTDDEEELLVSASTTS